MHVCIHMGMFGACVHMCVGVYAGSDDTQMSRMIVTRVVSGYKQQY